MIAIVDYNAGNLTSVRLAFEALGARVEVTSDPERVMAAERVVFPGVGAAGAAMEQLHLLDLVDALKGQIHKGTPFLGVCIGMQLLLEHSEEDGGVECLGALPGTAKRFVADDPLTKIPQMGWNAVRQTAEHPLLDGIEDGSEFYFVHSYYPAPGEDVPAVGRTRYANADFASMVARGNLAATQFHPERSGRIGLQLLRNFIDWKPTC